MVSTSPAEIENGRTAEETFTVQPPSISLPKGGGAIRGIGEKFAANPVTGTGSMSVPIAISPGRSGFGPELSLSYDSGSGNGPFGFGWSLSLPRISRKTDKGLPRYRDAEESDVFILSGAEDLVPVYRQDPEGTWIEGHPGYQRDADGFWVRDPAGCLIVHEDELDGYRVRRYRPRIEGLFARIERWSKVGDPANVHWRSISKDNILTLYGLDDESRIADPDDPRRIFTWLICETRDDRGNAVIYEYDKEDGTGVDLSCAHERNRGERDDPRRGANRYLWRILYGNRQPLLDDEGRRPRWLTTDLIRDTEWMFEVVLDYGEHHVDDERDHVDAPEPKGRGRWAFRTDPFSSYRAGFEVRTCRLCQRVLMFHHFPQEPDVGNNCLVRSTDFTYSHETDPDNARNPVYTFLLAVTQSGYKRDGDGYLKRSLPPIGFEYTEPKIKDTVEEVDPESLENLPIGVDGNVYQWTDLHGEGIPGILTEQASAWYYKRNLSPASEQPVELAPQELVAAKPNLSLAEGQARFMDLAGDGQPDVVVLGGPMSGFYEHDGEEGWQSFRPFTSRLERDTKDPNLRLIDLDGNGHADVLISEDEVFVWHPSLAEEGFSQAYRVQQALDEEEGPRLVFAESTQSIHLADLSGDGLTDLVRIRNGEVCYWPNLGYGRFGAKVTMDSAPHFDNPDQFEPGRLRLADVDGSGTTDILYLHRDGVRLYFNQSGNSWSPPRPLRVFPRVDDLVHITTTDLLGNGTACLVWSSPLPGDRQRPMRYVRLMGEKKPHLLKRTVNNLGAETRVEYAPSTKFYLKDKRAGKPWITRLPFPVHVVERVETWDHVSRNRFVTRYSYHHGYFEGEEREFRGFGTVKQLDTEELAAVGGDDSLPEATNLDEASHVPPVLTKTWFHTGVYVDRDRVSNYFAGLRDEHNRGEYYREPAWRDDDAEARKRLLPDTVMPPELTREEEREACRALKGSMLRQEVYGLDGTDDAEHPYTVVEQNFTVQPLQPLEGQRHAVFSTHPREALTYHYERHPADPRVQHALTLEVDPYGNVLKEAAIGYGRRQPDATLPTQEDQEKQTRSLITYTENRVTNAIDDIGAYPDDYRLPLLCETRTYELTGFRPEHDAARFSFGEWTRDAFALPASAKEIPYEETANKATNQKRLIEHVRTLFRKDDLTALSPLGEVEPMALPGESYKLTFTPGLLAKVFRRDDENRLPEPGEILGGPGPDRGGYVASQNLKSAGVFPNTDPDEHWWTPSGRIFLSPETTDTAAEELEEARHHFFLPRRFRDPFHADDHRTESVVSYDDYDLLMLETRDALDNRVTVGERLVNGDIDPAKPGNDYRVLQPRRVMDPNRNRTQVAFDALGMVVGTAVMGKPEENLGDSLAGFEADLSEAVTLDHLADPLADPHTLLSRATTRLVYDLFAYKRSKDHPSPQPAVVYTLARETHDADLEAGQKTRVQHSFSYSDGFEREIQRKIQAEPEKIGEVAGPPRWVGSGWTIFNNKGKAVRQYEPFFSELPAGQGHRFEFGVRVGVSPILLYDPLERVVATVHSNQTWEKVVFDPWRQETWDVNDTVLASDPRHDSDAGAFLGRLDQDEYLPTWHTQELNSDDPARCSAAVKAAAHANTPQLTCFDALGRPFLTIDDNGPDMDGNERKYTTHVELNIEGTQRRVVDAKGRLVMRYEYDLLSTQLRQDSMDAGTRWSLSDAMGKPLCVWDNREHRLCYEYDELRRKTNTFLREGRGDEELVEEITYGEGQGAGKNHHSKIYQVKDQAGIVINEEYDFRGNLKKTQRLLAENYKSRLDWRTNLALEQEGAESFESKTIFDALNRPIVIVQPDGSVVFTGYNEAGLIESARVNVKGEGRTDIIVKNVAYNARGQRTFIEHGNKTKIEYKYDEKTFRLISLTTRRDSSFPRGKRLVQDLCYTYDPIGNITFIRDGAQQKIFFAGQVSKPESDYTYDPLYRLIKAAGREHVGQVSKPQTTWNDTGRTNHPHPHDGQKMRPYSEDYVYDEVGNILSLIHRASQGDWARRYIYDEPSLLEVNNKSNRLTRTIVGADASPYAHDEHGSMTSMPHLSGMSLDFRDQLASTSRQKVKGNGIPEITYYVYDSAGQRVRKITEWYAASGQAPKRDQQRIYLGPFEIYRKYDSEGKKKLEIQTLLLMLGDETIAFVDRRKADKGTNLYKKLIRILYTNHLGSACLELDSDAKIITYEENYAYGGTSYQAVRKDTEVAAKRLGYSGKERDKESGFYYFSARYYAVWLGRWVSTDPLIRKHAQRSPYVGIGNNPLALYDPDGRQDIRHEERSDRRSVMGWGESTAPGSYGDSRESALYTIDREEPSHEGYQNLRKRYGIRPPRLGFLPLRRGELPVDVMNDWYSDNREILEEVSSHFPDVEPWHIAQWVLFDWHVHNLRDWAGDALEDLLGVNPWNEGYGITNLRAGKQYVARQVDALGLLTTTESIDPEIRSTARKSIENMQRLQKELHANDIFSLYVLAATMQRLRLILNEKKLSALGFTVQEAVLSCIEKNAGTIDRIVQTGLWYINAPVFDEKRSAFVKSKRW